MLTKSFTVRIALVMFYKKPKKNFDFLKENVLPSSR